jgi:hypothetical protein
VNTPQPFRDTWKAQSKADSVPQRLYSRPDLDISS